METRLECLDELPDPTVSASGIPIVDKMRFFHGDSPSRQYEAGQQKGGNFYCAVCGANAHRVHELDYVFHCPHISLEDRQQLVLKGPLGKANSLAMSNKPFQGLTKNSLIHELNARAIYEGDKKKELEDLLKEELHGVQRVPALLFTSPNKTLESINCASYEVLRFEPLHDIGKHIENLFGELPDHLSSDEASKLKAILELCIGGKDTKRTIDYRCALIVVSNQLRGSVNQVVQLLLDTLVEIQEIAYSSEAQRTPRSVLRFHNLTWHHAMLCKSVVGFSLKQMTTRKFYGNYFHNITAHAPIQNRLISGISANTEEQERVFNSINNITRMTSSNHPDHIIGNVFVRVQAEKEFKASQPTSSDMQQAHVSKLASSLPDFGNTVIPKQMLVNNYRPWQSHLERICDFLLAGEGIWWRTCENGDIEFFYAKGNHEAVPQGPTLHHFRSSNFKKEEAYLKSCWQTCLERKVQLPQIENSEGNMVFVNTAGVGSTNQQGDDKEVGFGGHCTDQCNDLEGKASDVVGLGIRESCTSGSEDVGVVDESVVSNATVVSSETVIGCEDVVVGIETVVGCEDVVVGRETAFGCEDVGVGIEMVVGCNDVVQTGGSEGCSSDQEIIERNARIVEVIEDIAHDKGLKNLTEANITDEGTCTGIDIFLLTHYLEITLNRAD